MLAGNTNHTVRKTHMIASAIAYKKQQQCKSQDNHYLCSSQKPAHSVCVSRIFIQNMECCYLYVYSLLEKWTRV